MGTDCLLQKVLVQQTYTIDGGSVVFLFHSHFMWFLFSKYKKNVLHLFIPGIPAPVFCQGIRTFLLSRGE